VIRRFFNLFFSGIFRSKTTRAHQKFVKVAWLTLTGIEFLNGLQLSGMEMSSSRNIPKTFRPLFCVGMLGKSTNYSTGTQPFSSTF
jgi:hypothetical protein